MFLLRNRWAAFWALALLWPAPFAHSAPVLDVQPTRLAFPAVTIGDTTVTSFKITNLGDSILSVSAIDVPPEVKLAPPPPYDLDPATTITVGIEYAPPDTNARLVEIFIHSNDPVNETFPVSGQSAVRKLAVTTRALTPPGRYPIGEAIVVQVVPADSVRIEQATLWYRSGNLERFQLLPMNPDARSFIALIPGTFVREGGVEFFSVVENSGFTATDPPEGESRPLRVDVDSPGNFQLSAVVRNPGFIWRVGESIDFLLTLQRGTVFESGTLHYRRGGDSLYQETNILESSFTGIAASIPADFVGPRGVEYWSEIQTRTVRLSDPRDITTDPPYRLRVTVENLAEDTTHVAARYRMFSIPLEFPEGTTVPAMLSDQPEFGSYDPVRWRAFRFLPQSGANVEFSPAQAASFELEPGRAFWLISRDAHELDTAPVPGVSTPTSGEFEIVLPPGWSQIGNPFAFPVPWLLVKHTSGIGDPVAFDSERNDYSDITPLFLQPFEGYFIENASSEPETLWIPPREEPAAIGDAASRVVHASLAPGAEVLASVRLEARGPSGVDLANRIGIATDARAERDARDRAEPPPSPGSGVRLAIANRAWSEAPGLYRHDFRPVEGEGVTWEIEVTGAAGEAVELALRLETALPAGMAMRFVDREQNLVVDLDARPAGSRHTVIALGTAKPYALALLFGTPSYLEAAATQAIPARLHLDPVSPNPASGSQRIRFGLPRRAAVRLEVFDAAGRRVATLISGETLAAGYHTAIWRPDRGGDGRPRSGVYFHRLTVGGETRTVRSVLLQ